MNELPKQETSELLRSENESKLNKALNPPNRISLIMSKQNTSPLADLRPDTAYTLKVESNPLHKPKKKLSKKDIKVIYEEVGRECRKAFVKRFTSSGLKNHNYDYDDLNQSAYLHFVSVTKKFDKSMYINLTEGTNVQGKKGAKRLSWYFLNFYQKSVNSAARDNKDRKLQKLGIFTKQRKDMEKNPIKKLTTDFTNHYNSVIKEPQVQMQMKSGLIESLKKELSMYSPEFQRFFKDSFNEFISLDKDSVQLSKQQIAEKYKKNYRSLVKDMEEFIAGFKEKYRDELEAEFLNGI